LVTVGHRWSPLVTVGHPGGQAANVSLTKMFGAPTSAMSCALQGHPPFTANWHSVKRCCLSSGTAEQV